MSVEMTSESIKPDEFEKWSKSIRSRQFELAAGDVYEGIGWDATVTKGSGDGGLDLKIHRGDEHKVVSVKQQEDSNSDLPPSDLREIVGVAIRENADGAVLLTNGEVSSQTKDEAMIYKNNTEIDVELIEFMDLYKMVIQHDLFDIIEEHNTDLHNKFKTS
jgi:restriction system protein